MKLLRHESKNPFVIVVGFFSSFLSVPRSVSPKAESLSFSNTWQLYDYPSGRQ